MVKKQLIKIFTLVFGFFILKNFCFSKTDGFSLVNIQSDLTFHPKWEIEGQNHVAIKTIVDQPFTYLDSGTQSYVFVSEDKKYVLKFFRYQHMRPYFPFFKKTTLKRAAKLKKTFKSYMIAMKKLKEETGLIYLHLNKTSHLGVKLKFYDKIGIKYEVPLDQMEFAVQKKAQPLYPSLEKWIAHGQLETAKNCLSNLVTLLKNRCKKQIFDKNPKLETNFGFLEEQAIQFDIGRFSNDPKQAEKSIYVDHLIRITDRLCKWLDEKSPELSQHIRKEIHEKAL